ncbi:hypothetical protein [Nocardia asteroides]|uniref:hypothetical protein n=1 Tax=Nocardia asteroides TaxID=1824 RepID=UPI0034315E6E
MSASHFLAAKQRENIVSSRKRTIEVLQSEEIGRQVLALLPEGYSVTDMTEDHIRLIFDDIVVPDSYRAALDEEAVRIFTVAAESDAVSASSRTFPDGSHLISISDAANTLCVCLCQYLHAWRAKHADEPWYTKITGVRSNRRMRQIDEEKELLKAGSAALRYYLIHQRTLGMSALMSPVKGGSNLFLDSPELDLSTHAESFILAHELGHILLGHTKYEKAKLSTSVQHDMEFEADKFAVDCAIAAGLSDAQTVRAAIVAISVIALTSEPLFVRMPELHPFSGDRFDRVIFDRYPRVEKVPGTIARELQVAGIITMGREAARIGIPLPESYWRSMEESGDVDTSLRSKGYLTYIRGIDMSIDFDYRHVTKLVISFRDGIDSVGGMAEKLAVRDESAILHALRQIGEGRGLEALETLRARKIERLVDPDTPLSWHSLIESLVGNSTALGPCAVWETGVTRATATMIAHLLYPFLTRSGLNEDRPGNS